MSGSETNVTKQLRNPIPVFENLADYYDENMRVSFRLFPKPHSGHVFLIQSPFSNNIIFFQQKDLNGLFLHSRNGVLERKTICDKASFVFSSLPILCVSAHSRRT
jgi:hypothetical protein